jgi:phenylpropionate dioxygenase-like ring-hydroxylating dioxygenase large terminal subunit
VLGRTRSFGDWSAAAVLYFYPDHAMVHELRPVSGTRTEFRLTWLVDQDASEYDVGALTAVWEATTLQDIELVERTQDGLRSRRYAPGPLSVRHEPYLRSSLNTYLRLMAGDPVAEALLAATRPAEADAPGG